MQSNLDQPGVSLFLVCGSDICQSHFILSRVSTNGWYITASVIPQAARLSLELLRSGPNSSDELAISPSRGITMSKAAISFRTRAMSCSFSRKTRYGFFTEFLRHRSIPQELLDSTLWKVRKSMTEARDAEVEEEPGPR